MRSLRPSTRASPCTVPPNAYARSICSMLDPSAHDTSARSAFARITRPPPLPPVVVVVVVAGAGGPGGAAARCRMGMRCRPPCGARRSTSRSCAVLCGMARNCLRMMTCGSPCASCAFSLSSVQSREVKLFFFCWAGGFGWSSVVHVSSSSRRRSDLSCPRQTVTYVCHPPSPPPHYEPRTWTLLIYPLSLYLAIRFRRSLRILANIQEWLLLAERWFFSWCVSIFR